ncbi:MAG: LysM peptidoglycan-binding domain-containing protein [Firmicutes bacterium]|nr:LysM peptidoglycan-binding domain-containing protein [Bacillota bacterium]
MKIKRKKYIIVDKIRFLIFVTIFMVFIITMMPVFKVNAKDIPDFAIEPIYVSSGDTLWHISVKYAPNNMDVRLYLDNLIQLNKLETLTLYPGDILYVPIYNN